MAFERRTWLARIGQGLNKFLIGEKDANGKQTLTNSPDSVTQEGDVISADNLNDLEDRIEDGFNGLKLTKLWENPAPSQWVTVDITFSGTAKELVLEYADEDIYDGGAEEYFVSRTKFVHIKFLSDYGTSFLLQRYSTVWLTDEVVINTWARNCYFFPSESRLRITECEEIRIVIDPSASDPIGIRESKANTILVPIALYKVGDIYNEET